MNRPLLTLLLVLVVLATACIPDAAPDEVGGNPSPTDRQTADAGPDDDDEAPPTPTATPVARDELGLGPDEFPSDAQLRELGPVALCGYAGEEFCHDANGNLWPDFVEEELGLDPTVDACAQSDCNPLGVEAFVTDTVAQNTLLILDASGSMNGDAGAGQTKMEAAKAAVVSYVAGTPDFADLGLMVYGHRGDNSDAGRTESCAGIETFAPIGGLDHTNVESVVGGFQATGWTPIAASLDAAGPLVRDASAADMAEGIESTTNRIVVISDGLETCDGDPVASAVALRDSGVEVVVDVVGFDLADGDRAALQEVAAVTGGMYYDARTGQDLLGVLQDYTDQYVELVDRVNCQLRAIRELGNCNTRLDTDAADLVRDVVDELDVDDVDRRSFITRWYLAVLPLTSPRWRAQEAELRSSLEGLQAAVDESIQRQQETLDAQTSWAEPGTVRVVARHRFDCPYDDQRVAADGVRTT